MSGPSRRIPVDILADALKAEARLLEVGVHPGQLVNLPIEDIVDWARNAGLLDDDE